MSGLPSESALEGIETFLHGYVGLRDSDAVLICYSSDARLITTWLLATLQVFGLPSRCHFFTSRDEGLFSIDLEQLLREARSNPKVKRVILLVCERDTVSFTRTLKKYDRVERDKLSVFRLTNCIPDLFELAFTIDSRTQKKINAGVLHKIIDATSCRIATENGTDLVLNLDSSRFTWVSNYGEPSPGHLILFPSGEVNTYPDNVSGIFVADGAFNLNVQLDFDVRLHERPIRMEIENGILKDFRCDDTAMMGFLRAHFENEYACCVGEFGIGTNVGITRFVPLNSHINERHPGVHIGFGGHGQPGRVGYQTAIHLDAISANATIETDNGAIIDTVELKPSELPHPGGTHCEDTEHLPASLVE